MKEVEGDTFQMGRDAFEWANPVHNVTVSTFYIGETEVTQALWKAVMGENPSQFKGDEQPVENVSWNDCQEFISKLNEKTGQNFRLPTEAEWEYAARGGQTISHYKYAGSNTLRNVAWFGQYVSETDPPDNGNSGGKPHPVKGKKANNLGLYDMSGNVWEWCSDWYESLNCDSQTNPKGPSSGYFRVLRGGSWDFGARYCQVWSRGKDDPDYRRWDYGFRLVLSQ